MNLFLHYVIKETRQKVIGRAFWAGFDYVKTKLLAPENETKKKENRAS